jgi:5,10-methylenetetrahydromethanopterin reductase
MLRDVTLSGTPGVIRDRIAELAAHGVTEIVYQPCGPDVAGELERFLAAATEGNAS